MGPITLPTYVSPSGMGPNTTQSTLAYPPAGAVTQPGEAKGTKDSTMFWS